MPDTTTPPLTHEFDSSQTCNYCGKAAERCVGGEPCPARPLRLAGEAAARPPTDPTPDPPLTAEQRAKYIVETYLGPRSGSLTEVAIIATIHEAEQLAERAAAEWMRSRCLALADDAATRHVPGADVTSATAARFAARQLATAIRALPMP